MNSSKDTTKIHSTPSLRFNKFKSMEQLKRGNIFNRHKRQNSMNELSEITEDLSISPSRLSINKSPIIKNVSNSPTSISSSNLSTPIKSPIKDRQISIEFSKSPIKQPTFHRKPSVSTFNRLKKKLSSFMDQEELILETGKKIQQRPELIKSNSESHNSNLKINYSEQIDIESEIDSLTNGSNSGVINNSSKEVTRKRSRTLGSIENDLYHKRNNSFVKAIGSMVLLKSNASTHSSSSIENDELISRPSTPPKVSEEDTEDSYIEKLTNEGFEFEICSILSERNSIFLQNCLFKFINEKFNFQNESLDISLRKFLIYCDLPKEAQQIDRVLENFSKVYYEHNIEYWTSSDQIYLLSFSFVMLQTDFFRLDNKKKMSKVEFVKNTRNDNLNDKTNNAHIPKEVLEYYYDNITFTKFNNIHHLNSLNKQPIYLLPRRIFQSNSSTMLDSSNFKSQQHTQRSSSVSSSTSQFFNLTQTIDPYFYILSEQLDLLKLPEYEVNEENPFQKNLPDDKTCEGFQEIFNIISNISGSFIAFDKDYPWVPAKTEVHLNINNGAIDELKNIDYTNDTKVILKIIKIGELYKEETLNSIFFPTTNRKVWKKYFGILTTCGFFLLENLSFLNLLERDKLLNNVSITIEIPDSILKSCLKISINGLFAVQSSNNEETIKSSSRFCFNIFSTNKKELFSLLTHKQVKSWINNINLIASLDGCSIELNGLNDNEVIPIRNITIQDKIDKLIKNSKNSKTKIKELIKLTKFLQTLSPFNIKTKDSLQQYFQCLIVRIDWLWYEIERNSVYQEILEFSQTIQKLKSMVDRNLNNVKSRNEIDDDSLLGDSFFINDEEIPNESKDESNDGFDDVDNDNNDSQGSYKSIIEDVDHQDDTFENKGLEIRLKNRNEGNGSETRDFEEEEEEEDDDDEYYDYDNDYDTKN
ncbi:hypothetical protein WICMUC_003518 [Wickerhamomyces mucosus]|uniref:SEC7 domain-containing protein n=1 Tax=Wickerhamomyces mucosus TaxID=1378264 RepID=A0A9P8PKV1_9ASCO|nr:hypothetical protein WICMUC_003518 [Wickerhamomyces mucosus]